MADNPVIVDNSLVARLITNSLPNKNFINSLGSFSSVNKADPAAIKFYSDLVAKHPEITKNTENLFKVLNEYANKVYPDLDTYTEVPNPFGGQSSRVALQNEKTQLIAKLTNGIQSFKTNILDKNPYAAATAGATTQATQQNSVFLPPPVILNPISTTTTTTTAAVQPPDPNVTTTTTTTTTTTSTTTTTTPAEQTPVSGEPKVDERRDASSYSYPPGAAVECGDASVSKDGVCVKLPTSDSASAPVQDQIDLGSGSNKSLGASSTSDTAAALNTINSWVISWEPTQKVGIVKVPLSKLIAALGSSSSADNVNSLQYYNDALLFNVDNLIDFKSVNRRIFLPLASNRMVILKEFSLARKNIQQVELTHGSKYFQVFTETFPEFTLSIEAVKFADIAKKVKLFFDNVMKRISEPSKYSGSLYIYDVLAEEIPSFNLSELTEKLDTGELIRYRLLPRSVKMTTSAEDPNMLKITLDGIIVEWEKQKGRFKIPKIPPATTGSGTGQTGGSPAQPAPPTPPKQLIGPNAKYANTFTAESIGPTGNNATANVTYAVTRVGNTLYKLNDPKVQSYYTSPLSSLWRLDQYTYDPDTKKYYMVEYNNDFSQQATDEIYKDTQGIYAEIFTYLSNNAPKNEEFNTYNNNVEWYNTVLAKIFSQLDVPTAQRLNFRKGFEYFVAVEARRKNNDDLIDKVYSFGINIY